MKIALFDDRYFSAYGAQRVMVSLASQLAARGWEPTVVTGAEGPLTDMAVEAGVPTSIVPVPPDLDVYGGEALRWSAARKARALGSIVGYNHQLHRRFDALGVDLVFANALRPLLYSVGARIRRRPVMWFLQGGEQFGAVSYVAPLIPNRIMAVSEGALSAIPAPLRSLVARRCWVNSPGIDVSRHREPDRSGRRALGLPDDATVVLVAGSIEPRKGFDVVVEALGRLRWDVPDLHLAVAGSARGAANEGYEGALRRRAAELGVPTTFLGWVDDMPSVMAAAEVFVLSSRLERLGLVTLEAMASGLPVVVSRAGGSEETVVDGESGLLVEPDDPAQLADALQRLHRDPALRQRLAAAGRRRVREQYTTDRFVDRFVDDVAPRDGSTDRGTTS